MGNKDRQYEAALEKSKFNPDTVYMVPMDHIFPDDTFNVRGPIQPLQVLELARQIQEDGLLQPITIQPYDKVPGKYFRIVAGYRRFKAHQVNKAEEIRSLVKMGLSDLDARLLNLIENTQRAALSMMQEARAIEFFKLGGWSQEKVAKKVGMSRGWVQVRFYLLDLPEEIQNEASAGTITTPDIHDLYRLKDYGWEVQMEALKKMKEKKILKKVRPVDVDKLKPKKPEKRVRSVEEVYAMQDVLIGLFGQTSLSVKMLAWVAGVVDDLEAHMKIKAEADRLHKLYEVPKFRIDKAQVA